METLDQLVTLAGAHPTAAPGLISAFGWVSAPQLQGLVQPLLAAADPVRRIIGMAACRLQQVDPGSPVLPAAAAAEPAPLRLEAIRALAALGRVDLVDHLRGALADPVTALEAATTMCLLGERADAPPVLRAHALGEVPCSAGTRLAAWVVLLQALDTDAARQLVHRAAEDLGGTPAGKRLLLQVCGLLGDVQLVPWLIEHMRDDKTARCAGEAFVMITGADLAAHSLERPAPAEVEGVPDDNPAGDHVALAEDDNLPWPDPQAVDRWWQTRAARLPTHARCFMGAPASVDHCDAVLRTGTQRQRSVAAYWLCMLQPGRKLFNIAAPAWRQQRLLGLSQ